LIPVGTPGRLARFGATIVAGASVLAGRVMISVGLRRAHEGWRRTVGILLRSESTRFALSAFGLRVPDARVTGDSRTPSLQERTANGLLLFLATEPDAHFRLEWRAAVTLRHRIPFVDLVVLEFGDDGVLLSLTPYLAQRGSDAPPVETRTQVHAAIVSAYNKTAQLPEVTRTRRVLGEVRVALESRGNAWRYAERILSASCLSFEDVDRADPERRFRPPAFSRRRTLGFGYLSWVARADRERGSVDLWVSAQHVGLDGVPLQDVLNRLERAWGIAESVVFPPATGGGAFHGPECCHASGERAVDHLLTFVDLSPVIALRRKLNERYACRIGGETTVGALVGWLLSEEPEFSGVRIASTVDVPASHGYDRDVDVVSLRPADYMTGGDPWNGFVEYVREFNRLISAARNRTSPVRAGMQTAGLIPPWAHATLVRADPAALDKTFGTLCVTIVRDARVFVAPMTDLGLGHGFFAIGSTNLPTASGSRVTAVTVKGDAGRVAEHPAVLHRAIGRAAALLDTMQAGTTVA
jgi:hypothetical protein